jgi:hypothetical protein
MKRLLCIAMFAVALMLPGSPVTLVNNGKAASMIILDDKPTASAQMAALEINFFLKKISGTELPVIKKSEKSKNQFYAQLLIS